MIMIHSGLSTISFLIALLDLQLQLPIISSPFGDISFLLSRILVSGKVKSETYVF